MNTSRAAPGQVWEWGYNGKMVNIYLLINVEGDYCNGIILDSSHYRNEAFLRGCHQIDAIDNIKEGVSVIITKRHHYYWKRIA